MIDNHTTKKITISDRSDQLNEKNNLIRKVGSESLSLFNKNFIFILYKYY